MATSQVDVFVHLASVVAQVIARDWPIPGLESQGVNARRWWREPWLFIGLVFDGGKTASPGAGGRAGRRPPEGLGLDPGEDGAKMADRTTGRFGSLGQAAVSSRPARRCAGVSRLRVGRGRLLSMF